MLSFLLKQKRRKPLVVVVVKSVTMSLVKLFIVNHMISCSTTMSQSVETLFVAEQTALVFQWRLRGSREFRKNKWIATKYCKIFQISFLATNEGTTTGAIGMDNIQLLIPKGKFPEDATESYC